VLGFAVCVIVGAGLSSIKPNELTKNEDQPPLDEKLSVENSSVVWRLKYVCLLGYCAILITLLWWLQGFVT